MNAPQPVVVVTDIERGVFGSPESADALDFLAAHDIPLVINASRTRAEIERLHHTLHIVTPFICENGAALFLPQGCFPFVPHRARRAMSGDVIDFGLPYAQVVDVLRRTARQHNVEIVGFADLSIEEVSRELDVSLAEARLAKLREYSELFRIVDDTEAVRQRLVPSLNRQGLRCRPTGRHYLATGAPDRADSVRALRAIWKRAWRDPLVIGLGDSLDDVPWLRQVDIPVIVRTDGEEVSRKMVAGLPHAHVTGRHGPTGWSEAIFYLLGGLHQDPAARPLQHPGPRAYSACRIPEPGGRS
jgi:mannosyl-3-phosphoglycerate phosphatase family protein